MGWSPLSSRDSWAGRRTHLSGGAATLLSSHAGPPCTVEAGTTHDRQPETAARTLRAKPRQPEPNHHDQRGIRHPDTERTLVGGDTVPEPIGRVGLER